MNYLVSIVLSVLLISGCKKNQLGGKSEIKGTVMHHSKVISNASVFIKFNAREFPGNDTLLYDDKVRADHDGSFSFKCYKGDYYLYGFGYDYAIPAPYYVKGGVPVTVRNKETSETNVAVTE